MLRASVLDHKGSWEEHFPLVEFAYNNSYQASIQMAPYEALYGRPCRSPLCWTEVGESSITGPDLIRDTSEKVSVIRQRLLTAQSRQKSYADVRRRPLEFEVRDHVFLKVMPKRGVVRFGKRGKLSPRFIGPFEILERVGTVAYRLVKVLWRHYGVEEFTWEREDTMWATYPFLFRDEGTWFSCLTIK